MPHSSHAHSLPLDLAYLVENTPIDREEELTERNIVPSQRHSAYAILQKGPFKPKYKHVTHYFPNGNII